MEAFFATYNVTSRILLDAVSLQHSGVGVAQLAEHWIVAPVVVGSNPIAHPLPVKERRGALFCLTRFSGNANLSAIVPSIN